jgi:hypothetical protein
VQQRLDAHATQTSRSPQEGLPWLSGTFSLPAAGSNVAALAVGLDSGAGACNASVHCVTLHCTQRSAHGQCSAWQCGAVLCAGLCCYTSVACTLAGVA